MTMVAPARVDRTTLGERLDLIVAPVFAAVLAVIGGAVWLYSDIDDTTRAILAPEKLQKHWLRLLSWVSHRPLWSS